MCLATPRHRPHWPTPRHRSRHAPLGAAAFGIATLASLRSPQWGVHCKAKAFYRTDFTPPLPDGLKPYVVNFDEFWNVDEACSFYARAHTVICHEPHTPIMALANGTPMMHTFSEFHSPKCWMFKDIGLEEWAPEFDSTPATQMFEILMGIHKDYPAAQAKVKKAMAFVEARAASQMKVLKGVIKA